MGQLDLRSNSYVILDFYGTRLNLTTILYYIVRVLVFISTSYLVGTISIVFISCTHISCGVDIILLNLCFCTVNI